jgi:hypothetical protein
MFFSMHGLPAEAGAPDVESFLYFLATQLHKSVTELRGLPALEIVQWKSYFAVKHQAEDLARKAANA